jgi:hypothetical protein
MRALPRSFKAFSIDLTLQKVTFNNIIERIISNSCSLAKTYPPLIKMLNLHFITDLALVQPKEVTKYARTAGSRKHQKNLFKQLGNERI